LRIFTWFAQFWQDVRLGIRNLAKSPAFTAIALGSLALGIGATTAMYSVIYAVIIDPFPYKDIDNLAAITIRSPDGSGTGIYRIDDFAEVAERNTIFSGAIASTWDEVTWTGESEPQHLRGNHCTFNTFEVMGVPPLFGRVTTPADAAPGAEPVVVLGYKFWQRQFGNDRSVLGRRMQISGVIRTVIGVMPKRFMWRGADVYLPVHYRRGETPEGVQYVSFMGRLKPGVTEARADADLRPIVEELQRQRPSNFPKQWRVGLQSFKETYPSSIGDVLWILFGAVGLLFLIACVNVSNLLLSRAAYRQSEMAIRASMGASRFRLVRQLLAESLVLGIIGGLLGAALAYEGLRIIIAMVPPRTIPDESEITLNAAVLLFTLGVSVMAALLFGLAPALHLSGRDILTPLKEGGRGAAGSIWQRALRATLIVGEVALSLMLLVGASLMLRTFLSMRGNPGIQADKILTMRIPFSPERYPSADRRIAFLQDVLRRVEHVPGVTGVAVTAPYQFHPFGFAATRVEVPGAAQQDTRMTLVYSTSEGYLRAMGIELAQGRFFNEQEVNARLHSAAVNQAFVRRYFAGRDPMGQTFRIPMPRLTPGQPAPDGAFQIVGVVKDTLNRVQTNETLPEIYIPFTLMGYASTLVVSGPGGPDSVDKPVRAQIYAVDSAQSVMDVKTVAAWLDDFVYAQPRFNLLLFGVFAGLGLTLALCGVYGVISNSVAQQTREIGIRMALGASFQQVMRMVLATGARMLAIGIVLGLGASLVGVRYLKAMVRNVSTFDPYSFAAVALLLFAAGLFASFWPARRAARVDPLAALREN
jgi:predicted permease